MNPHIALKRGIPLVKKIIAHQCTSTTQYTASGEPIRTFLEIQLAPIKTNTLLRTRFNRIEFQNVGTTDCQRGNWTIAANGGRDGIGSTTDANISTQPILLTFADKLNAAGKNNVQARIFLLNDPAVLNYKY